MFQLRLLLEEYLWGNYLNSQSLSLLFCKCPKWTFAVWIKDTKLRSLTFPLVVGRMKFPHRRLGPSPWNLWLLLRLMAMGKLRWTGGVKVADQLILRWEIILDYSGGATAIRTCVPSRFSPVRFFATPWTVACQAPLSIGFSRQESWSVWPCSSPVIFPNPGSKPESLMSIALASKSFTPRDEGSL